MKHKVAIRLQFQLCSTCSSITNEEKYEKHLCNQSRHTLNTLTTNQQLHVVVEKEMEFLCGYLGPAVNHLIYSHGGPTTVEGVKRCHPRTQPPLEEYFMVIMYVLAFLNKTLLVDSKWD